MSDERATHMTAQIVNPVLQSVAQAFEMMLECPIRKTDLGLLSPSVPYFDVTAAIGLMGEVSGSIGLSFPRPTACRVVKQLLDIDADEIDELVRDSVGEMANIVGGGTKDKLGNMSLRLGLPQIQTDDDSRSHFPASTHPIYVKYDSAFGPFMVTFGFVRSNAMKILLVEQDPLNRATVSHFARQLGYEQIFECEHVQQGLEHLQESAVDLVITGEQLNQQCGHQFAGLIQRTYHNLPVVMLKGSDSLFESPTSITAHDLLLPPYAEADVKALISKWLNYPNPIRLPAEPARQLVTI